MSRPAKILIGSNQVFSVLVTFGNGLGYTTICARSPACRWKIRHRRLPSPAATSAVMAASNSMEAENLEAIITRIEQKSRKVENLLKQLCLLISPLPTKKKKKTLIRSYFFSFCNLYTNFVSDLSRLMLWGRPSKEHRPARRTRGARFGLFLFDPFSLKLGFFWFKWGICFFFFFPYCSRQIGSWCIGR